MLLSVRLDSKTKVLVERLAKRRGATKSDVIREAVAVLAEQDTNGNEARTPYQSVAHLIGCADSGGQQLSRRTGRRFRVLLEERARGRRTG
jgi:hypothetical protein